MSERPEPPLVAETICAPIEGPTPPAPTPSAPTPSAENETAPASAMSEDDSPGSRTTASSDRQRIETQAEEPAPGVLASAIYMAVMEIAEKHMYWVNNPEYTFMDEPFSFTRGTPSSTGISFCKTAGVVLFNQAEDTFLWTAKLTNVAKIGSEKDGSLKLVLIPGKHWYFFTMKQADEIKDIIGSYRKDALKSLVKAVPYCSGANFAQMHSQWKKKPITVQSGLNRNQFIIALLGVLLEGQPPLPNLPYWDPHTRVLITHPGCHQAYQYWVRLINNLYNLRDNPFVIGSSNQPGIAPFMRFMDRQMVEATAMMEMMSRGSIRGDMNLAPVDFEDDEDEDLEDLEDSDDDEALYHKDPDAWHRKYGRDDTDEMDTEEEEEEELEEGPGPTPMVPIGAGGGEHVGGGAAEEPLAPAPAPAPASATVPATTVVVEAEIGDIDIEAEEMEGGNDNDQAATITVEVEEESFQP